MKSKGTTMLAQSILELYADCNIFKNCFRIDSKLFFEKPDPDDVKESIESLGFTDIEVLEEHGEGDDSEMMLFLETQKGRTILHYDGYQYRRKSRFTDGTRWQCAVSKECGAYLCLNKTNDIVEANTYHDHEDEERLELDPDESDTAVVITSRKGKEMLLFRKYTYRKQYIKSKRCRWVCSTMKNCRGCVFTDHNNFITSAFEEHCHEPPKYYLNPDHVLEALRPPGAED